MKEKKFTSITLGEKLPIKISRRKRLLEAISKVKILSKVIGKV